MHVLCNNTNEYSVTSCDRSISEHRTWTWMWSVLWLTMFLFFMGLRNRHLRNISNLWTDFRKPTISQPTEGGKIGIITIDGQNTFRSCPGYELAVVLDWFTWFTYSGSRVGVSGGREAGMLYRWILRDAFDCDAWWRLLLLPGNTKYARSLLIIFNRIWIWTLVVEGFIPDIQQKYKNKLPRLLMRDSTVGAVQHCSSFDSTLQLKIRFIGVPLNSRPTHLVDRKLMHNSTAECDRPHECSPNKYIDRARARGHTSYVYAISYTGRYSTHQHITIIVANNLFLCLL